jgi:hypothetical protein
MTQYYEGGTCERTCQEDKAHFKNRNISLRNSGFSTLCNGATSAYQRFHRGPHS